MKSLKRYADLHVHTYYSDGKLSPAEVVRKAKEMGLGAIAITDHDSVRGIDEAIGEGAGVGVEVIPGVEITSAVGDREIHVLGYFIDWKDPVLVSKLEKLEKNRRERMLRMIERLAGAGLAVDPAMVLGSSRKGTVGRLHLAHVMAETGLVGCIEEAFARYIGDGKSCYVRHERLEHYEAVEMIRKAGGIAALAHPASSAVDRFLPELVSGGIAGVEVFHTKHSAHDSVKYKKLAEEYSLLTLGGSDCHGLGGERFILGKVAVDRETVEALKDFHAKRSFKGTKIHGARAPRGEESRG